MEPKRRRQAAVTIPRKKRTSWRFLSVLMEIALFAFLSLVLGIVCYIGYQLINDKALLPLHRIILSKPLKYGSVDTLKEVVKAHASGDLIKLDVQNVAKQLEQIAWVRHAEVEKHWLDAIYLDIVERYPVVRWGDHSYLDKDGKRFELPYPPQEKLFLISGPDGYEQNVLSHYRIFEPWLLAQQTPMTSIRLDDRLVWHIGMPNGIDVILGRDHLNERLKKLVVVYRRVIQKYQQYIQSVDLRYQDGFSIRWKAGYKPVLTNDEKKVGK